MLGMFHGISFSLFQIAQVPYTYFREDDPMQALIVLAILGGIIAIALVVRAIRGGVSPAIAGKAGSRTMVAPRKFNGFTLRRIASSYGLDRKQSKLLEFVFRNDAVSDPERVMNNTLLLDRHFRRAYRTIERRSESEEAAQERLVNLFSLRNTIEAASSAGGASPPRLLKNTAAILMIEKDNFPVKVISTRGHTVVVDVPRNTLGSPIRIGKGANVTLSFFTKSSEGFSLSGNVAGVLETDRGPGLQISHTGKLKPLVRRMYRRKNVSMKCDLFLVNLVDSMEGKKAPRMVVDSRKFSGTVLDISAGGCALKASAAIPAGSRLKISVDYEDRHFIHLLGQVIRTNRSGSGGGTILHVKFLKVPRRAFNAINALVYGYDDI
ncbi:MAG: PilZ domain-containing protein [Treponema sp.]|nr:PilZ domain-containing protein [Treponema sp.]